MELSDLEKFMIAVAVDTTAKMLRAAGKEGKAVEEMEALAVKLQPYMNPANNGNQRKSTLFI